SRLYSVEPTLSITGSNADERLAHSASKIGTLVKQLHDHLKKKTQVQDPKTDEHRFLNRLLADLKKHKGRALVVAGDRQPAAVHELVCRINAMIGAHGKTLVYTGEPAKPVGPQIKSLVEAIQNDQVQSLLILGGNPVYNAPADLKFAEALKKVKLTAHLSAHVDETSRLCHWHLPASHYLESWSDARAWDGSICIQQPLILPIHNEPETKKPATRSALEVLALMAGLKDDAYELVRKTHNASADEKAWRKILHDGFVAGSAARTVTVEPQGSQASVPVASIASYELVFVTDPALHDGRFANNGWLQELPDPLTRLTWDNALLVGFDTAEALGLEQDDLVELAVGPRTLTAAVCLMPWQATGTLAIALGYGRDDIGHIASKVGFNAYTVRTSNALGWVGVSGEKAVKKIGTYQLVSTQDHHLIDTIGFRERQRRIFGKSDKPRSDEENPKKGGQKEEHGGHASSGLADLYRRDTLENFKEKTASKEHRHYIQHAGPYVPSQKDPRTGKKVPLQIFDNPIDFDKHPHKWALSVDLTACTGCGACVVACQAENNIPIVGKEQVAMGREMHWIRIDRYYESRIGGDGKPDKKQVVSTAHQPVMCHHCENAPCEQVCPVAATTHDSEGLNVMVYNRCIGTRYCSNNCHYKVRRFNFFDWHSKDPKGPPSSGTFLGIPDQQQEVKVDKIKRMVFNPDVTVRMRGVMEKCTFCVQRIKAATIPAKNKGRRVADGQITPACAQTCPSQALTFGDLHDPTSRVSEKFDTDKSLRGYEMLKEMNVRARVRY
ncbi:MAG: 4Fe-4S dicluster domain-containing protein, partial [Phycisphaeraceae bacterium]|nr:4Fe-4S dicluster domain-containing protein [Phycisphaeraceae bacterium]